LPKTTRSYISTRWFEKKENALLKNNEDVLENRIIEKKEKPITKKSCNA